MRNCIGISTIGLLSMIIAQVSFCDNGNNSSKSSKRAPTTLSAATKLEIVDIDRLYATSVQIPYFDNAPENLFDDNTSTVWKTMPGSGPNEGLMLYFSKATFVKELHIKAALCNDCAKVISYGIYVNGSEYDDMEAGKPYNVGVDVRSLFIKIKNIQGLNNKSDETLSITHFDSKKSVAISEISLFDKNGPLHLAVPKKIKAKVKASSTLSPASAYHTDYLFDGKLEFGWAEGNKASGVGESLQFHFDEKVRLMGIRIWNGYQRSQEHYKANERLKNASFSFEPNESWTVKDSMEPQDFQGRLPMDTGQFDIKMNEVYPGSKYKDLVISELQFLGEGGRYSIFTGEEEDRKLALIGKVKGSSLEMLVDRNIENLSQVDQPFHYYENSITLRSNQSFVFYLEERTDDMDKNLYADGNWEIVTLDNAGKAQIKVFGKIRSVKSDYNPYSGGGDVDSTRIFSEILTIDSSEIKGTQHIPRIVLP